MAAAKRSTKHLKKDETVQVNTSGGAVRISQPTSQRGRPSARHKAAVVVDVVTPPAVDGFLSFLREHAVVGLAVGLVIGSQLKAIVDTLNASFINELFKLVLSGDALSRKVSHVHWHGRTADLGWGAVVYQIIDFIFIMAVVYAIIKVFKLDKLDQPKDK